MFFINLMCSGGASLGLGLNGHMWGLAIEFQ